MREPSGYGRKRVLLKKNRELKMRWLAFMWCHGHTEKEWGDLRKMGCKILFFSLVGGFFFRML
jgi:hypothetical protein